MALLFIYPPKYPPFALCFSVQRRRAQGFGGNSGWICSRLFNRDTRPERRFGFPHAAIAAAPHPWLVIEDSAHTFEATAAVLAHFDPLLAPGDHLVVEVGVVADLPEPPYRRYEDGPNRAVRGFLLERQADYRIARDLCDFFGHNVTWCPNGWLVRKG